MKQAISSWIDNNKDEILRTWMDISKVPAIKGEKEEGAPFGKKCKEALEAATHIFEEKGFGAKIYENDGYSLISWGSGEKNIGIFTHSDVVPVGEDWLYTTPFEPIIKENALIGRGVEDNKSGIIAAFCAMRFLKEHKFPFKSKITLFIGSDEESGMSDIKAFRKNHPMPHLSLIPDADFPCSTGEKGICHFFAEKDERLVNIIDFYGGEAFNVVLDNVTVTLKYKKDLFDELCHKTMENKSINVKKDEDKIKIYAKGVAKHASAPEGSVNAAYLAAELLADCETLAVQDRRIMQETKQILASPFGTTMGLDYEDDLFGRLTIPNGMARLEDGKLKLSFDMRYSSLLDSDKLIDKAKRTFGEKGWTIDIKNNSAGFSLEGQEGIISRFEKIYKEITGEEKKSVKLGGGTYARELENAISVGTCCEKAGENTPIFKMPPGHGGAHQCDEMIDIERFFNAVMVIIFYLIEMDSFLNEG